MFHGLCPKGWLPEKDIPMFRKDLEKGPNKIPEGTCAGSLPGSDMEPNKTSHQRRAKHSNAIRD